MQEMQNLIEPQPVASPIESWRPDWKFYWFYYTFPIRRTRHRLKHHRLRQIETFDELWRRHYIVVQESIDGHRQAMWGCMCEPTSRDLELMRQGANTK